MNFSSLQEGFMSVVFAFFFWFMTCNGSLKETTGSLSSLQSQKKSIIISQRQRKTKPLEESDIQPETTAKTALLYFSWVITQTGQARSFDVSNTKAVMPLLCLTVTDRPQVVLGIRKSYATSKFEMFVSLCNFSWILLVEKQLVGAYYLSNCWQN